MQQTTDFVPVIAIDGPSASGKGTVAQRVADRLGFYYLDSGALYRLVAVAAAQRQVALDQETALAAIARDLPVAFVGDAILLNGEDVSAEVRSEATGGNASRVAALPLVREALLQRQRDFRQAPGLVADGRDMGSVVFPYAGLKIFLTASAEVRAQRRCKQLIEKGLMANGQGDIFTQILQDIVERDQRDASRPVAPLKCYPDAHMVDTTDLSIDQAVNQIIQFYSC
ncbi:MAG: (d)CMP kinase [Chitinivorax sp.]